MFIDMIFISVEHCFTLNYMIGVRFTTSVNLDLMLIYFVNRTNNFWKRPIPVQKINIW
jgi:hypothetical protein